MNDEATRLAFWGVTIHLIVDWLLQNDWMARYKSSLKHRAAWVHWGLHYIGLMLVFPVKWALLISIIHLLIDTRVPLIWWRKTYRQTVTGDIALHVAIWGDQVAHWAVICIVALLITHFKLT